MRVLLQLLLLLCLFQHGTTQQEPSLFAPKFDYSYSYRSNVCDRQGLLWNETIDFPDALRGLNLTVAITNYQTGKEVNFFSLQQNNRIHPTDPGLFAVILDEVAKRAGFSWRNSFAVVEPRNNVTDGNKTWTDILIWSIETFDISMEKWGQSIDRMGLGASFPVGWYDSSVVIAELYDPSQTRSEVNLWAFLDPFGYMVWIMIGVAILYTGMVYWVLENWNKDADELHLQDKPMANIFYAAIVFTGHYELQPNTHATRILGFSFTFWALIVASAYTANLASFLVSPRVAHYKFSTIEQAIAKNAVLCVQGGAIIEKILRDKYPGIQMVGKDSEQDIYASLRLPIHKGGCHAAAHQLNTYEIYEHNRDVNYDCGISSEKRVQEILPAGMAVKVDAGPPGPGFCSSLISHVLDYHLLAMADEGFIQQAWSDHLNKYGTIECVRDTTIAEFDDDSFSLGLQDVGGIFIVHVILCILSVGIATWQFYRKAKANEIQDSRTLKRIFGIEQITKLRTGLVVRQKSQRRLDVSNSDSVVQSPRGKDSSCSPTQTDSRVTKPLTEISSKDLLASMESVSFNLDMPEKQTGDDIQPSVGDHAGEINDNDDSQRS